MDIATIDQSHAQLQRQSDTTVAALRALNDKLQAAAQAGNQQAREWALDLREIALAVRDEQRQVDYLLQNVHDLVVAAAPQGFPAPYQQQPYGQPQPANPVGGFFARFAGRGAGGGGGGIGGAIARGAGMGVGIGAGESLFNDLFD